MWRGTEDRAEETAGRHTHRAKIMWRHCKQADFCKPRREVSAKNQDTLILDFQPPELWKDTFPLFNPPSGNLRKWIHLWKLNKIQFFNCREINQIIKKHLPKISNVWRIHSQVMMTFHHELWKQFQRKLSKGFEYLGSVLIQWAPWCLTSFNLKLPHLPVEPHACASLCYLNSFGSMLRTSSCCCVSLGSQVYGIIWFWFF